MLNTFRGRVTYGFTEKTAKVLVCIGYCILSFIYPDKEGAARAARVPHPESHKRILLIDDWRLRPPTYALAPYANLDNACVPSRPK